MMEEAFWIFIFIVGFFCGYVLAGIILGKNIPQEEPEEKTIEEEKPDPMSLRNGLNVTKTDKPTFMEQIVNVMNYNGENQKEGAFDEEEN